MENVKISQIDNFIEHETITLSLYKKDQIMKVIPTIQIIDCIKKLNYYNVNVIEENKKYIINKLLHTISDELYIKLDGDFTHNTIYKLIESIKETKEYIDFITDLNYKVSRAFVLSKFMGINENTFNFYNALTLEELNKLNK